MSVSGLTGLFLQKSTPKAASGLLSALPKDVTDQFTDQDKQKFKGTRKPKQVRCIEGVIRNNWNKRH